ncbi:MAG: AmmeMemoRadiSam system radical SAM enzyme [Candidatus Aenigmarchaeota archaeon]|nr:AmmeMemoRadiSam system radical SAM enzyme [Candidatus Aenigmarchaeota archaeon]
MKEALLYQQLANNKVKCLACAHQCVLAPNQRGICGVRINKQGKLYSLIYQRAITENVDPIEKKPLFHFLPGSLALSIATIGCNFTCLHCQNFSISQYPHSHNNEIIGQILSPQQVIDDALANHCQSIAYTYTEPTIFFEYALAIMKLAKKNKLKNVWVSNGYFTEQTARLVAPYLDAINIDLKFFDDQLYQQVCGGRLQPILNSLKLIKQLNVWLEVTTLLIPGYTDQKNQLSKIAKFIANELDVNTPWHISRFSPVYKMLEVSPTPIDLIKATAKIGKQAGLHYVYTGNFLDDKSENTYCPNCQTLLVQRQGYQIERFDQQEKCPKCGQKIDLIY